MVQYDIFISRPSDRLVGFGRRHDGLEDPTGSQNRTVIVVGHRLIGTGSRKISESNPTYRKMWSSWCCVQWSCKMRACNRPYQ